MKRARTTFEIKSKGQKAFARTKRTRIVELILLGAVLFTFALLPLIEQVFPEDVDYDQTLQHIPLKPGMNKIDNLVLTLDKTGRVLHASTLKRHITHLVFGFRNLRTFLEGGIPFLSLLSLCFFFIWYDKQRKNRRLRRLKRIVLGTFLFTAVWFVYWVFVPVPKPTPVAYPSYYTILHFATALSLLAGYYGYRYYLCNVRDKRSPIGQLVSCVLQIKEKHYFRAALRALINTGGAKEVRDHIQAYEQRTAEELKKVRKNY